MGSVYKVVRLHREAQADLQSSVNFYRDHGGEHLAQQFKSQIKEALRSIQSDPVRFPLIKEISGIRKCVIRQFPYSILFTERNEHIWVVAVAHGKRRPGFWSKRT